MDPKRLPPLTDRQVKFVHEYLIDFSGAKAAKRAGYAPKHAAKAAYDLLRLPHVVTYLQQRQKAVLGKCEVQAAHVLEGYRRIAFVDLGDAFDRTTGQMRTMGELDPIFRQSLEAVEVDAQGRLRKFRVGDRLHALDSLAQHLGITEPARDLVPVGTVTQVNVTEVYLERLTTAQLDELDRLLEAAGMEGAPSGPELPTIDTQAVTEVQT